MLYKKYIKRLLDLLFSTIGLILLSPVFAVIFLCIKLDSKGPLLFKQPRVGKNKVEFTIYKFRTMKVDTPSNLPTWLLEDPNTCITRIGRILRKSSMDELPQILNIFKGEMSFIGPRPILRNENELFLEREKNNVYSVLPGLTGLAQISGRDHVLYKEKARFDGEYVRRMSFKLDSRIFLLTIVKVLKADGVNEGVSLIKEKNSSNEKIAP